MTDPKFRFVYYMKVALELSTVMHIGGEGEDDFGLCTDGSGRFIIPASSIAGAVREYIESETPEYNLTSWFGENGDTEKSISKIFFYDSVCNDCNIEKRIGIKIDSDYGVAKDGSLHEKYFMGSGMKTEFKIQMFLNSDGEKEMADKIAEKIISGFASGRICLGGNKTNGAGRFKVKTSGVEILDMLSETDLNKFLEGVEKVFSKYITVETVEESDCGSVHDYCLKAYIPNGLLVKSGDSEKIPGTDNYHAIGMKKSILDNEGEEKSVYYIPGSTLKGILRAYAREVCAYLNISDSIVGRIFGQSDDSGDKMAGSVTVYDTLINEPNERIYNRVKIDRWLGSAMDGALFSENIISTSKKNQLTINIDIDERLKRCSEREKSLYDIARALIFLALRDIGLGIVPIGSGNSVGYGRLKGKSLYISGKRCNYKESQIDYDECEQDVDDLLSVLGGIRNED